MALLLLKCGRRRGAVIRMKLISNKAVLVVAYDPLECNRFCELLSGWGYVAIPCADVPAALIAVRSEIRFDTVIVCHDDAAGIDGLTCAGELKKYLPRIPIILWCASLTAHTYLKALGLGVFECLEKTIDVREFRRVIAKGVDARVPADLRDFYRQEGRVQ